VRPYRYTDHEEQAPISGLSGRWWRAIVVCHVDNYGGDGGWVRREDFMVTGHGGTIDRCWHLQHNIIMVWNGLESGTRVRALVPDFIWNEGILDLEQIWNAACPSIWNFRTV
jgi:hypothetical protein